MSIYINTCIYIQIYIYIISIYIDDVIFFTTSLFTNDWAPLMLYSAKVICNYEVTLEEKILKSDSYLPKKSALFASLKAA